MQFGSSGVEKRMQSLIHPDGYTLITPFDDLVLSGPEGGLADLENAVDNAVAARADAVLAMSGLYRDHGERFPRSTGRIVNITESTTEGRHTLKTFTHGNAEDSIANALRVGADAIAVHCNISSHYEDRMISNLGVAAIICERLGLPLFALMYPRAERGGKDYNYHDVRENDPEEFTRLVSHAVAIGADKGAHLIKTIYTGSPETFKRVVKAAGNSKVVIAGEALTDPLTVLRKIEGALTAGAIGLAGGRNAFNSPHPLEMMWAFGHIIHDGMSAEEAYEQYVENVSTKEAEWASQRQRAREDARMNKDAERYLMALYRTALRAVPIGKAPTGK